MSLMLEGWTMSTILKGWTMFVVSGDWTMLTLLEGWSMSGVRRLNNVCNYQRLNYNNTNLMFSKQTHDEYDCNNTFLKGLFV